VNDIPRDETAVEDAEFLSALDPERPDLKPVRRAAREGDLPGARTALVEHFRTRPHPRWFFDFRDGRHGRMYPRWPETGDSPRSSESEFFRRADALLSGRLELIPGIASDLGPDIDMRRPAFGSLGVPGNIFKRVSWVHDLGMAYVATGRPEFAACFARLAQRFLDTWPLCVDEDVGPESYIFCRSRGDKPMPTGFRAINWLDALHSGLPFAPGVPVELTFRILKSLWFIALQYRRFESSPYREANHHLWQRGTVPYVLGMMLPEFPEAARLLDQGQPVLAAHAERSFLPDGGYEERSTSYTIVALKMYTLPLELARRNEVALLTPAQEAVVRRCAENLAATALPDGSLPDIGDQPPSPARAAFFLGQAAGLLNSPVAATVLRKLQLELHVPPDDWEAAMELDEAELPLIVHQPASGRFVARDGWSSRSSAFSFSVPAGGLPNHSHDDALDLQIVARGARMIGTPAGELYVNVHDEAYEGSELRAHFRAMTSHNVVLGGGEPLHSLQQVGNSGVSEIISVDVGWSESPDGVCAKAAHEDYPGTRLSREVAFRHGEGWTVTDRVKGDASEPHVARWHFEYGVEVAEEGGEFVARRDGVALRMAFEAPGGASARLYRDQWLDDCNPRRPGKRGPWVLDVAFGGTGDDELYSEFLIDKT